MTKVCWLRWLENEPNKIDIVVWLCYKKISIYLHADSSSFRTDSKLSCSFATIPNALKTPCSKTCRRAQVELLRGSFPRKVNIIFNSLARLNPSGCAKRNLTGLAIAVQTVHDFAADHSFRSIYAQVSHPINQWSTNVSGIYITFNEGNAFYEMRYLSIGNSFRSDPVFRIHGMAYWSLD